MRVKEEKKEYGCEDCGFFHDCPIDYKCPAKETLDKILSADGAIFAVRNRTIFGLVPRSEEDEEE